MTRPAPRADENTRPADIPERPRTWQPKPRNVRALDDHIIKIYGEAIAAEYGIYPRRRR